MNQNATSMDLPGIIWAVFAQRGLTPPSQPDFDRMVAEVLVLTNGLNDDRDTIIEVIADVTAEHMAEMRRRQRRWLRTLGKVGRA